MILVVSTSSPVASVAFLDESGTCLWERAEFAPRRAGGACLTAIQDGLAFLGAALADVTWFVADAGPGGFTGVRVGVTMAKTLAFAQNVSAGGVSSLDLIAPLSPVAVPIKRGEYVLRIPGEAPQLAYERPELDRVKGYGEWFDGCETHPQARSFGGAMGACQRISPFELLASYGQEPSISTPKRSFAK